jgi:hypothetical protein
VVDADAAFMNSGGVRAKKTYTEGGAHQIVRGVY